jgi:adenylate cyclase class IV
VSLNNESSSNGTERREFEFESNVPLIVLDYLLTSSGLQYLSKWSRKRKEFTKDNITITIDTNAGYGTIIELEILTDDESNVLSNKEKLYDLLKTLNLEELNKDRLERMFKYYNKFWSLYYQTDKTFIVE